MSDNAIAIVDGWARIAEEYEPRPLNSLERRQIEKAAFEEDLAKRTSFVLGKPLHA